MRRDYNVIRGTTVTAAGTARGLDSTVIDLTGAALEWRIGSLDRAVTDTTITGTVVDAAAGKYSFVLTPAVSDGLTGDKWHRHEGRVTEAGGKVTNILEGYLKIRKGLP